MPTALLSKLKEGYLYRMAVIPGFSQAQTGRLDLLFTVGDYEELGQGPALALPRLPERTRPKMDVRGLLADLLRKGETPALLVLLGETAIVDQDVKGALQEVGAYYRLDERRVPLTDPQAVAQAFRDAYEGLYHAVALIRGGRANLEVLDSEPIWQAIAQCQKPVIVAVGHAADTLWVEALADAAFPTPTAFGTFLRDLAREVHESKEKEGLIQQQQQQIQQLTELAKRNAEILAQKDREIRNLQDTVSQLQVTASSPGLHEELARLRRSLTAWRYLALGLGALVLLFLWVLLR